MRNRSTRPREVCQDSGNGDAVQMHKSRKLTRLSSQEAVLEYMNNSLDREVSSNNPNTESPASSATVIQVESSIPQEAQFCCTASAHEDTESSD